MVLPNYDTYRVPEICSGKLLRDAQPELMDALIQATKDGKKDGDYSKLQGLTGSEIPIAGDDDDNDDDESDSEEEEEVCYLCLELCGTNENMFVACHRRTLIYWCLRELTLI